MEKRFWGRLRAGRAGRFFSAYLAAVLMTAIIGPGLAVYAAENETTAAPTAPVPVDETPAPVVDAPDSRQSDGIDAAESVATADDGAAAVPQMDAAALVAPEPYDGNPPEEEGCYRTEDPTTTTYIYDGVSVEVTTRETAQGWVLDFESTAPVTKVTVKGGPDANIYNYDPAVMSDEGLHAPVVPSAKWPAISHVDFCFGETEAPEAGDLIIRKFEDLDEDGIWDEGEPTLSGWDFTVYDEQDVELGTGTTDANGWLMFAGLPEGDVTVVETLEIGWTNTTPLAQDATIVAGGTARLYFGNVREVLGPETGSVLVHKFEDFDEDGIWDEGEPLLANWYFRVHDNAGLQLDAGYTGDDGTILFANLPEGDVVVTETLKPGWNNTTGLTRSVSVVAGQTSHVFFGNVRCVEAPETGNLIIRKFEDLDEDGTWDEGEPTLEGWLFTLYDDEGAEIDSGLTDENGWLMFDGLAAGEVTAVETLVPGWLNTTPLSQDVMIVAGASAHLYFGNMRQLEEPETGALVVRKFEDVDEDGLWDEGEPLLGGWDFTVYDDQDVQIGSGTTDANGWLMWEGLPEGEVTVVETLEPGWMNTTPLSQSTMIVGGETSFLYFGNVPEVLVPEVGNVVIHKYLDDNENGMLDVGEQFLPGWAFVVRDGSGTIVATGSTNMVGEVAFELPVGAYTVTETLTAGWTNTTALTQSFTIVVGQTQHVYFGNAESFLPFTPRVDTTPGEPFLPFTGGEYLALVTAALASSLAGVALRRRPRR